MKKSLVAAGLLLAAVLPASADVKIRDLVVSQQSNMTKARITVANEWKYTQKGPIKIRLYARSNDSADWQLVRSWDELNEIPNGRDITKEVSSGETPLLGQIAQNKDWEVKATVEAPDVDSDERSMPASEAVESAAW